MSVGPQVPLKQVQVMVQRLLGLSKKMPQDASDALAAAICHIHSAPLRLKNPKAKVR